MSFLGMVSGSTMSRQRTITAQDPVPPAIPVIASSESALSTGAADFTVAKPTGVAVGDGLLILVGMDLSNISTPCISTPSGFTLIDSEHGHTSSDVHIACFYRVADGTETATAIISSINDDTATDKAAVYLRLTGIDTTAMIDISHHGGWETAVVTHTIPSITTTTDNTLAFYVFGFDGGDGNPFSVPTGWTEEAYLEQEDTGAGLGFAYGIKSMPTAGATGDALITPAVSDGAAYLQFAIRSSEAPALPSIPEIATYESGTRFGAGSTAVIDKPTGIEVDDGLLIFVSVDLSLSRTGDDIDVPTGFTLIGAEYGDSDSDVRIAAFYRVADGTEAATISTTFSGGSSQSDSIILYLRLTNIDTAAMLDTSNNGGSSTTDQTTHTIPSITTTTTNTLAFYLLGFDGGDGKPYSTPTGWFKEPELTAGDVTAGVGLVYGTKIHQPAGATGDALVTPNTVDGASYLQFAIKGA